MRIAILFLIPAAALTQAGGVARFDAAAAAKLIAPFLDEETVAVARVDLTRIDGDVFVEKVAEPVKEEELEARKKEVRAWLKGFKAAGGREMYLLYGIDEFPGEPTVVVPLGDGADAKALARLLGESTLLPDVPYKQVSGFLVGAGEGAARRLARKQPAKRPEVARALAAAGDGAVQFALT